MKKRLLAIIATVAMVVAMMPSMVFGAEKTVSTAAEFQSAIDSAVDGDVIKLGADITGDVTVVQAENVKITIDGAGKTFKGTITVDGKSARYDTAGLTIKNVNFDATSITKDASINLGSGSNSTRYTNHVTVEDCNFTGANQAKVAIKSYTGGDKNLVVIRCKVDATMHSLLQVANVEEGLVIDTCVVKSKNGINLNSSAGVEIKNCEIDVNGYALRAGAGDEGGSGEITLTDNILKTDNSEGDAVIVIRGNAVTDIALEMSKNVVSGATHISGNTADTDISADANYWDGKETPVTNGTAVEVSSYYTEYENGQLGGFVDLNPPAPAKPVDSPNTGDNSVAPFAVAGLVLAAMAAAVVARRRYN